MSDIVSDSQTFWDLSDRQTKRYFVRHFDKILKNRENHHVKRIIKFKVCKYSDMSMGFSLGGAS